MDNKGINQNKIQEANRSLVIRLLQKNSACSRAELSRITGLTQATITNIVTELINNEIVEEIGLNKSSAQGRRSIQLKINGKKCNIIGIRITRAGFTVGIFGLDGRLLDIKAVDVKKGTAPQDIIQDISAVVSGFRKQYSRILAIGIAVPGPYLKNAGRIAITSETAQWKDINIPKAFSELFEEPIFIERDANAGAMANWWFVDFPKDVDILCHMLLSDSVSVGVVENGVLRRGQLGAAGELGHVSVNVDGPLCECGNRGCLELYCSAAALKKNVLSNLKNYPGSSLAKLPTITYKDIFEALDRGDTLAVNMVDMCARYIGYGIVNIVNAYNPGIIVLNDVMIQGGDRMMDIIKATVKERILPELYERLIICYNPRVTDPVLAGAAAIATDYMVREHLHCLLK